MSEPVSTGFAARLLHYAVAGTAGNLIVKGAARVTPMVRPHARRLAVSAISQGIVLSRRLEATAEDSRLKAGDLLAEARAELGESATPPRQGDAGSGDVGHEH